MLGTHAEDVEGFTFHDCQHPEDGKVVQIVARVRDWRFLDDEGQCAFFVRFPSSGEVELVLADALRPWFPV